MADTTGIDWVEQIGRPAYESIAEMVAALEADRDRLEELRDERDAFEMDEDEDMAPDGPGYANNVEAWEGENAEDAKELKELEAAVKLDGKEVDEDAARERIQEDALSVEVRSGWTSVGDPMEAEEFCILLSTGGPAVRIVGELDEDKEPHRARLEVQDWGKPWTEYFPAESDTLLTYCRCFNFGE